MAQRQPTRALGSLWRPGRAHPSDSPAPRTRGWLSGEWAWLEPALGPGGAPRTSRSSARPRVEREARGSNLVGDFPRGGRAPSRESRPEPVRGEREGAGFSQRRNPASQGVKS